MSDDSKERPAWKHPIAILLGTIVIGAIGSGLWDVCAKPVLFGTGRALLNLITFGSTAVKDSAYADAAMDQTAIMSLQLYLNTVSLLCTPFLYMMAIEFGITPRRIRIFFAGSSSIEIKGHGTLEERLARLENTGSLNDAQRTRLRRVRKTLLIAMGLTLGYLVTLTLIRVQSLQIWRCFHSDLRMCAPYLTEEQEELFLSNYSKMKSKADFTSILSELQAVAETHRLVLHSSNLW